MQDRTRKYVAKSLRLMDQVREVLRFHHYAYNTEKSYVSWILQYIRFHNKKHPKNLGKAEVEAFLSHLAINRNVSASTQNQALNALVFLYKQVLNVGISAGVIYFNQIALPCTPRARTFDQSIMGRLLYQLSFPCEELKLRL